MFLLADSGSTKTHWNLVKDGVSFKEIFTAGINPFYQTQQEIEQEIKQVLLPQIPEELFNSLTRIFFYGAGCIPEKIPVLQKALQMFFPIEIEVNNDLLATCRALSGREVGIVAILGTGSNSCLFDGAKIVKNVSPLGFILGDEGSGAVLGKLLVADILKNQLPDIVKEKFFNRFNLTSAEIMERVYRSPFPNRFLAGLSVFIKENMQDEPLLYAIVEKSFTTFFERNILQYGCIDLPIHFSGSIAYYYQDVLNVVAKKYDFQIGKVETYPMSGLIDFHSSC